MKARRWITAGTVHTDWYVMRANAGYPHGYCLVCRGRAEVFRPMEVLGWRTVAGVIDVTLAQAGLKRVGKLELGAPNLDGFKPVRVLVERGPKQRKKRHEQSEVSLAAE